MCYVSLIEFNDKQGPVIKFCFGDSSKQLFRSESELLESTFQSEFCFHGDLPTFVLADFGADQFMLKYLMYLPDQYQRRFTRRLILLFVAQKDKILQFQGELLLFADLLFRILYNGFAHKWLGYNVRNVPAAQHYLSNLELLKDKAAELQLQEQDLERALKCLLQEYTRVSIKEFNQVEQFAEYFYLSQSKLDDLQLDALSGNVSQAEAESNFQFLQLAQNRHNIWSELEENISAQRLQVVEQMLVRIQAYYSQTINDIQLSRQLLGCQLVALLGGQPKINIGDQNQLGEQQQQNSLLIRQVMRPDLFHFCYKNLQSIPRFPSFLADDNRYKSFIKFFNSAKLLDVQYSVLYQLHNKLKIVFDILLYFLHSNQQIIVKSSQPLVASQFSEILQNLIISVQPSDQLDTLFVSKQISNLKQIARASKFSDLKIFVSVSDTNLVESIGQFVVERSCCYVNLDNFELIFREIEMKPFEEYRATLKQYVLKKSSNGAEYKSNFTIFVEKMLLKSYLGERSIRMFDNTLNIFTPSTTGKKYQFQVMKRKADEHIDLQSILSQ